MHKYICGHVKLTDWRDEYTNCYDCTEYQDNEKPTDMCGICKCCNCDNDRSICLDERYCIKYDEEF